jgi:hypothetical protein
MRNRGRHCVHAKEEGAIGSDEKQQKSKMRREFSALIVKALLDDRRREKSNVEDQKPK